jgi:predicted transcriptional regulator
MKAVLLSIRPNWCKLIWSGMKTVEVRKTRPKLETPFKVYIYCTKAPQRLITIFKDGEETMDGEIHNGNPVFIKCDELLPDSVRGKSQMVIGEFICDDIRRIGPEYCIVKEDIESAISGSCLTVPQVKDYAGWKSGMSYADLKDLYGWHISDLKIYDRPRPLSDFTRLRATKFGYEPVDVERPPQSWFYVEDVR